MIPSCRSLGVLFYYAVILVTLPKMIISFVSPADKFTADGDLALKHGKFKDAQKFYT